MRLRLALLAAAARARRGRRRRRRPSVEIKDAVARVTVIPEDRSDVKVEMLTTNADLPLRSAPWAAATIIDGNLRAPHPRLPQRGDNSCGLGARRRQGRLRRHAPGGRSARPRPSRSRRRRRVRLGRPLGQPRPHNSGCSGWTIADVAGDATLRDSGAGSVGWASAGPPGAALSGAGEHHATAGPPGPRRDLSGAGGGDRRRPQRRHWRPTSPASATSRSPAATPAACRPRSRASAAVEFGGAAESLDASISGLGDIRVKAGDRLR